MVTFTLPYASMQDLSSAYGEELVHNGQCLEGGLILARAGKCERALTVFENCLEWRQAVMMATQLNFTDQQFHLLARRLAGKHVDISLVQLQNLCFMQSYNKNCDGCTSIL